MTNGNVPIALVLFLIGCARETALVENVHSGDRVASAYRIAEGCGLSGQIEFRSSGGRDLLVSRLDPNADYEKVDCVLRGLMPLDLNLGFVGNEAPSEMNNAQAH